MKYFTCPYCHNNISLKAINNWIKAYLRTLKKTRIKFFKDTKPRCFVTEVEKLFLWKRD